MKTILGNHLTFDAPLWRFSIARNAIQGFRFTNQFLGLHQVAQRPWLGRVPAILSAGVLLTVYLWMGGFSMDEAGFALAAALVALAASSWK